MKKTSFRADDGSIIDTEEVIGNVAFFTYPANESHKYWRMEKGNVQFHPAPSVKSFRQQLDRFFNEDKCGCCFFGTCNEEMAWLRRKLELGAALIASLKALPSDAANGLLKSFDATCLINPFLSQDLLHEPNMANTDIYREYMAGITKSEVKLERVGRKSVSISDPKTWTVSVTSEDHPLISKLYWREETYEPRYIPAMSFESLRLSSSVDPLPELEAMTYGLSPLEFAYTVLVLEALEKVAIFLKANDKDAGHLYKSWLDCDLSPMESTAL